MAASRGWMLRDALVLFLLLLERLRARCEKVTMPILTADVDSWLFLETLLMIRSRSPRSLINTS